MKHSLSLFCLSVVVISCQTTAPFTPHNPQDDDTNIHTTPPVQAINTDLSTQNAKLEYSCPGNTELPEHLSNQFKPVEDDTLLKSVLGQPNKGALCQAKVYQSVADSTVTVYRAWNSTNTNSEMGTWWAGETPEGLTAQYRTDYEICYQWSPLDKMTQCKLKAGSKVVIGTGQSAMCSDYLTYPASPEKQIYIQNASEVLEDCEQFDAIFNWQSI